jgi:predicted nucleic acid-binding protein
VFKHIFIDANVLLDIFDESRIAHTTSKQSLEYCLTNDITLFTSCDLITSIYYVSAKQNPSVALEQVQAINTLCTVIAFSNREIEQTCQLMRDNKCYKDLEDSIQYVLAKQQECDLILSNDKGFISEDIELLTTEGFCRKLNLNLH